MKKNNMYWMLFAPMIKESIKKRYGGGMADLAIKRGKKKYETLVEYAPELGNDNRMGANAYFAYVFVGAWLGTGKRLSPDDMALVMADVLGKVRFFFGLTDLNKHPKKWNHDMRKYAKWYDAGNGRKYSCTWNVHFDDELHKEGSYYYFTNCPICSYLHQIGLGEIMKPLCETDEIMFKYQHGVLHRKHTIASGDNICDYWIVGDQALNPH